VGVWAPGISGAENAGSSRLGSVRGTTVMPSWSRDAYPDGELTSGATALGDGSGRLDTIDEAGTRTHEASASTAYSSALHRVDRIRQSRGPRSIGTENRS
jgi:hypothetical protein